MIRKSFYAAILALGFFGLSLPSLAQQTHYDVVPLPNQIVQKQGVAFTLNEKTQICYQKGDKNLKREAQFLSEYVKQTTGLSLKLTTKVGQGNQILLQLDDKIAAPEGYSLKVCDKGVLIQGKTPAGVFYGVQTLRKVLAGANKSKVLSAVEINDAPRFSYRGAHLDVSRHFITADSVRRFIDMLALHNINRLHWHLTDDQGWRVEIKKYPKLVKVGSYRPETVIGHNTENYDGTPHQGYYTQKEIRAIVKYAQERHITIVPEIDMPGHMQAALAAYPELGCTGGPYEVWKMWGVSDHVLCAGNDKVLQFIDDVLNEIVALFPSEYIHVGGDECPKVRWKDCPKCQARIKEQKLEADHKHTAEERLQSYIIRHAGQHLATLGRKMIGWDEILEGGLAPGATVMSWRGEAGGVEAAKQGHD
ncbi:MAG: beta-N-acetylhexosaminidase, partial [Bacteroidaceae bacterium]|nr:beta-N-acetylhexosaminidase [Bacteroidaceae bacterium]